ncbi:Methylated-DNA--protein-cysteine methyltransferase, constitutive [Jeotgalibaca dankookensis]|uniref:Methylated-DNA--protein-cysteine methyltransferase n=1 Tax=Jeotgalibaca dankookensis TaxID=708126 RepID=A0A1S6IM19_9LACT|nr:methylated-DNA--[protein]-cysteine S-methyltransferase [Jeotgalibaca dankookensis]AQS52587.1 Methylated-DNA--protein-cysteine methyltransferase, constitutive [Jeotgalibaca dankookensis]
MNYLIYQSPIGAYLIGADDTNILAIDRIDETETIIQKETPLLRVAKQQLSEYFAGQRTVFDLPIKTAGTAFQQQVWQALKAIPYGETRSYKEIATAIDNPKAVRAVGGANNKNPISIVIPCHRVIGSSGQLVGYGGGLDAKVFLLALESQNKKNDSAK